MNVKNKRGALLCVLLLLISNTIYAQQALLWKIEGEGLEHPSYLYGTIHQICKKDYFLPGGVEQAFNQCDQLVMEIDMNDPELMQKMQKWSLNPNLENLSSQLDSTTIHILNDYFYANYGMNLSNLGVFKPVVLLSMVLDNQVPCEEAVSYEMQYVEMAKSKQMSVVGIESVEEQLSLFDTIPVVTQYSWIVESIQDSVASDKLFRQMIKAYINQDLNALHALIVEDKDFHDFQSMLLEERNRKWIKPIITMISEKPSFIAVGAGHLASETGVIALLRKEGFKVSPVIE